jgi:cephalosporin hydroxylase
MLSEMRLLRPLLSAGGYGHPVLEHEFPDDYPHDVARAKEFGWTQAPNGFLIRN